MHSREHYLKRLLIYSRLNLGTKKEKVTSVPLRLLCCWLWVIRGLSSQEPDLSLQLHSPKCAKLPLALKNRQILSLLYSQSLPFASLVHNSTAPQFKALTLLRPDRPFSAAHLPVTWTSKFSLGFKAQCQQLPQHLYPKTADGIRGRPKVEVQKNVELHHYYYYYPRSLLKGLDINSLNNKVFKLFSRKAPAFTQGWFEASFCRQ